MNKLYYNVSIRPLRHLSVGHQYDHNNLTVIFEGFTRVKDNSTIYVKMGSPIEAMVPLSDNNELVVQNYMTKESTRGIPCQLVEYGLKDGEEGTYELINSSKVFYACVDESVAEEETPEVTDPSLDLIYTQMHKMYLTIKNAYESGEFKGQDGHTPIKGTDYWTDTDKQEIVDDTVEAVQPTLDEKADKNHTHMSSDVQMYEGDTDYTLNEYMEDVDHDLAFLYKLSDSFIGFPIHDYNKSASYKAGFFVLYYVEESNMWSVVVYKAIKDVPGNTEETYLPDAGVTNGYWKKYYIQDEIDDMSTKTSVLMSVIESSDPPDDYAISYQYQAGTIVKCNGIYYRCLKGADHHNYSTELPSPGVENGFWEPLTTLTNLYPATYMANEWKAQEWKVGQIVKHDDDLFKCIKETYSFHKDAPDNDTEHWERYEGTNYGDELVASIEAKADKEHFHDYDDVGDKTSTLSLRLEDIEGDISDLFTGIGEVSEEILNRYTKSETYSQEEVNDLISKIPKFAIEVVDALPTSDISATTVYLLKTSETETNNLYTEYVYIDSKWEMLGTQKLDLSNYYKSSEVDKLLETEKTERQNACSDLSTNIANEATVRESADTALEKKLTDEVTTARAAEQANANAITSEVSRAETAEKTLQSNIDEETKARENADKALETKISDTDSKKVGYQEVSGNTLYMYTDSTKAVLLATLELPAAPVQDVQINGSSIVSNGVATITRANDSTAGVIKSVYGYGLQTNSNYQLYGVTRTAADYNSLSSGHIISKGTLNSIQQSYVDGILCSTDESKALTTEQQIAARERIGAEKSGEWELLRDYTFNESRTGGIQINTDEDGNTFELRKYFYQLITPASVSGNIYFYMDYIAADGITKKTLNQTIGDALQASKTVYSAVWYDGLFYGRCGANQGSLSQNSNENYILPGITPKGIRIYSSVNDTIPTGTRILLYGIRK